MDLHSKLRDFSFAGIRSHPTRNLLLMGVGCVEWTWPIVQEATSSTWLGSESGLVRARGCHWNLARLVGAGVFNHTRDDFAWSTVCKIIDTSARYGLFIGNIKHVQHRYPGGCDKFTIQMGGTAKRQVQDLAKTILWTEALTFLVSEGFEERLTQ